MVNFTRVLFVSVVMASVVAVGCVRTVTAPRPNGTVVFDIEDETGKVVIKGERVVPVRAHR